MIGCIDVVVVAGVVVMVVVIAYTSFRSPGKIRCQVTNFISKALFLLIFFFIGTDFHSGFKCIP